MRFYIKSILTTILISFFLEGCYDDQELGGKYYYFDYDKEILTRVPNKKEIYSEVLKYNYDTDFIIAIQKPSYDSYISNIDMNLRDEDSTIEKRTDKDLGNIADSVLRNDPFYKSVFVNKINYWIIDKKADQVIGPLTYEEYLVKRKELSIPDKLDLK